MNTSRYAGALTTPLQVFDTSPLPGKRPHPLDERAYTLALTLRALKAFTVAGIELKTLAAPHAGTLGAKHSVTHLKRLQLMGFCVL